MSPRHGRLGAELTGYDQEPGEPLRVDVVDREALTTVASLTPTEALNLAAEMLTAVSRARNVVHHPHDPGE